MSVKAPVNDNRDSNEFVRELFTSEIKEPFSHNIAFNDVNDVDKLFEKIKQIFMIGAMIHCGDLEKKVIFMDKMTPNIFEKLTKYMLSLGIDTKFLEFKPFDVDYIYRTYLNDIKYEKNIKIDVSMDYKTEYINKVSMTVSDNNPESIKLIIDTLKDHPHANTLLRIKKATQLKEHFMFFQKNDTISIIKFDFANIEKYSKKVLIDPSRKMFF